jgi:hypothetical protein
MQFALLAGPFNDTFKQIKSVGEHQLGQCNNETFNRTQEWFSEWA